MHQKKVGGKGLGLVFAVEDDVAGENLRKEFDTMVPEILPSTIYEEKRWGNLLTIYHHDANGSSGNDSIGANAALLTFHATDLDNVSEKGSSKVEKVMRNAISLVTENGFILTLVTGTTAIGEEVLTKLQSVAPSISSLLHEWTTPLASIIHLLPLELRDLCMQGWDLKQCLSGHLTVFCKHTPHIGFLRNLYHKGGGQEGRDRISLLPSGLSYQIVGFLPPIQAIRTSILSYHWLRILNTSNGRAFGADKKRLLSTFTTTTLRRYITKRRPFSPLSTHDKQHDGAKRGEEATCRLDVPAILGIQDIVGAVSNVLEDRDVKSMRARHRTLLTANTAAILDALLAAPPLQHPDHIPG